eukprot:GSA120T00008812001.1
MAVCASYWHISTSQNAAAGSRVRVDCRERLKNQAGRPDQGRAPYDSRRQWHGATGGDDCHGQARPTIYNNQAPKFTAAASAPEKAESESKRSSTAPKPPRTSPFVFLCRLRACANDLPGAAPGGRASGRPRSSPAPAAMGQGQTMRQRAAALVVVAGVCCA